jgi:hypothetical protein
LGIGAHGGAVVIAIRPFGREIFLDGDFVFQRFVHGPIGDAEAAGAQHALDLVTVQAKPLGSALVSSVIGLPFQSMGAAGGKAGKRRTGAKRPRSNRMRKPPTAPQPGACGAGAVRVPARSRTSVALSAIAPPRWAACSASSRAAASGPLARAGPELGFGHMLPDAIRAQRQQIAGLDVKIDPNRVWAFLAAQAAVEPVLRRMGRHFGFVDFTQVHQAAARRSDRGCASGAGLRK